MPVAVVAADPISKEGAVSQLRRQPEVELREESAPGTVALVVENALDENAVGRLRRIVRGEGARAALVVGTLQERELLDVVECGVGAIVWRHEATARRLVSAVLAASRGDGDLPHGPAGEPAEPGGHPPPRRGGAAGRSLAGAHPT